MFEGAVDEMLAWPVTAIDARLRQLELARRALEAEYAATVTAAESRQAGDADGHRSTNAYLRATTNQPGVRVQVARARFCRAYPAAGDALWAGRVGVAQIDTLARRLAGHPRVGVLVSAELVAMFLDHAEQFSYREFTMLVDRWINLADQDGAFRDLLDDIARRTASIHNVDGTVHVHVAGGDALTTERLKLIFDRFCEAEYQRDLTARREEFGADADQHPLPRHDWQRRYDAFVAIFDTANTHLDAPGHPVDATVNVLIDQTTLHDAFAQAGVMLPSGDTFDPTDLDQLAEAQREALLVELCDPHHMLDTDHRLPWSAGGPTNQPNSAILCNTHNRWKHTRRWRTLRGRNHQLITIRPDGTLILPAGQRPPPLDAPPAG